LRAKVHVGFLAFGALDNFMYKIYGGTDGRGAVGVRGMPARGEHELLAADAAYRRSAGSSLSTNLRLLRQLLGVFRKQRRHRQQRHRRKALSGLFFAARSGEDFPNRRCEKS
jgi:hypothetical protein